VGVAPAPAGAGAGRVFVVRRGALGLRVLCRHPYGRVSWLDPGSGARAADGVFADAESAARAVAREVLRQEPEPGAVAELARLLAGPGLRREMDEDDVRRLLARTARAA
jgi:hypothetical protein